MKSVVALACFVLVNARDYEGPVWNTKLIKPHEDVLKIMYSDVYTPSAKLLSDMGSLFSGLFPHFGLQKGEGGARHRPISRVQPQASIHPAIHPSMFNYWKGKKVGLSEDVLKVLFPELYLATGKPYWENSSLNYRGGFHGGLGRDVYDRLRAAATLHKGGKGHFGGATYEGKHGKVAVHELQIASKGVRKLGTSQQDHANLNDVLKNDVVEYDPNLTADH
ncbi:unnamed protein product [Ixodes pacificus]